MHGLFYVVNFKSRKALSYELRAVRFYSKLIAYKGLLKYNPDWL